MTRDEYNLVPRVLSYLPPGARENPGNEVGMSRDDWDDWDD